MRKNSPPNDSQLNEDEAPLSNPRRDFLARSGLMGAVAAISPMLLASSKSEASLLLSDSVIRDVFNAMTLDTFAGVSAFVLPGNDWHSISQGHFNLKKGAKAANTQQFLLDNLDNYLPWPKDIAGPILSEVARAFSNAAKPIPFGLALVLKPLETLILNKLDEYMDRLIDGSQTVPLGHVFSLILNVTATLVNPLAIGGSHLAPFSRLSFSEKAEVFKRLETGEPGLSELISLNLNEAQSEMFPTLMATFSRTLIQLTAFGALSEWHALDQTTRELTVRPIGWDLTQYLPNGNVEGWDDFLGYYQDRSQVDA